MTWCLSGTRAEGERVGSNIGHPEARGGRVPSATSAVRCCTDFELFTLETLGLGWSSLPESPKEMPEARRKMSFRRCFIKSVEYSTVQYSTEKSMKLLIGGVWSNGSE